MKKIFLLSLFLFSSISRADVFNGTTKLSDKSYQDVTINGTANLQEIKVKKLNVNGPLQFSNLLVEEDAEVHGPVENSKNGVFVNLKIVGPFSAEKIVCDNLSVMGAIDVSELVVKKTMQVTGGINIKHGDIKDLEVNSSHISLVDSKLSNLTVNGRKGKEQTLILDKTVISGDVIFKSGKGIIEMSKDSVVKGKIAGATLKK